jgi:hypothetical protein
MRDETKNDVYMVLPFVEYDLDHAINAINTPFNTAQVRPGCHHLFVPIQWTTFLWLTLLPSLYPSSPYQASSPDEPAPAHRLLSSLSPHRAPVQSTSGAHFAQMMMCLFFFSIVVVILSHSFYVGGDHHD